MMSDNMDVDSPKRDQNEFKKPILIGRIGKLPKKAKPESGISEEGCSKANTCESSGGPESVIKKNVSVSDAKKSLPPAVLLTELSSPIPYKEPKWSGLCPDGTEYGLEVLKSGMIVEKIELTTKPYYVFGRLANCDVYLAHPTISRHHAVLQYKAFADDGEPQSGWYLYDLGSTHGTFLNRERIKDSHYVRVRVGHQIKFGNSTRTYIVLGPDFDAEGESELTVTEIKKRADEMKKERERMIHDAALKREADRLKEEKRIEEQGIDWGMGEDAEEEPDLADNPYASTANEELYLADPKKTLRGYFEREGHELVYDCEERGVGQFICRVELPMDDARGRPVIAEVIHRGKKKEAVVTCALEACRMLDRAGLLRQAKHESRRRKERDWSADDYYDSDDDTFLDRTGSVEKKRQARMEKQGAVEQKTNKALTYDDLVKQVAEIENSISNEEKILESLRATIKQKESSAGDDDLDEYMKSIGNQHQHMSQKAEISRTKMVIHKLKAELAKTNRLAELARPTHLPPLIKKDDAQKQETKMAVKQTNSVIYGKRIRLKEDMEKKSKVRKEVKQEIKHEDEFVEEVESDEETETSRTIEESIPVEDEKQDLKSKSIIDKKGEKDKKIYGPMRPPENYVIPENYFDQETDRDLPEIVDNDS